MANKDLQKLLDNVHLDDDTKITEAKTLAWRVPDITVAPDRTPIVLQMLESGGIYKFNVNIIRKNKDDSKTSLKVDQEGIIRESACEREYYPDNCGKCEYVEASCVFRLYERLQGARR
ncbi:hypothetical protein HOE41_03330 [Candidatus Woesearchaeota archaeon]|nr:hypothetical protein [Candidatus Woesearchaeota archaeon]